MGEEASNATVSRSTFSDEELRALNLAIGRVQDEVLKKTLTRMKAIGTVAIVILTAFGIASIATIKSAIVEAAANKLANDADLRERMVTASTVKLARVNEVMEKANAFDRQIEAARLQAVDGINADLDRVLRMTEQIRSELKASAEKPKPSGRTAKAVP